MCTCSGIISKEKTEWHRCDECQKDLDLKVEELMNNIKKSMKEYSDMLSGIPSIKRGPPDA